MMMRIVLVMLAGGLGALARWGTNELVGRLLGSGGPPGTALANIAGCFLFGIVWTLADERLLIGPEAKAAILTGFMGAFTTFSTFIFESGDLLRSGQWPLAVLNLSMQLALGMAALFGGFGVGRAL